MKVFRGFTLIELMVVIIVIAILAVIAAPSYKSTIDATKVLKTSDFIAQIVGFAKNEAVNENRDLYLSIQGGASPAFCLSTTTAHTCDVRSDLITSGVTVTISDSTGTEIAHVQFSGISGVPTPSVSNFLVTDGTSSQSKILNILGMVTTGN